MAYEGFLFGRAGNGVILCGSSVPARYAAGVRKIDSGEWLLGWQGQEHGVDPKVTAAANAHRRPAEEQPQSPKKKRAFR